MDDGFLLEGDDRFCVLLSCLSRAPAVFFCLLAVLFRLSAVFLRPFFSLFPVRAVFFDKSSHAREHDARRGSLRKEFAQSGGVNGRRVFHRSFLTWGRSPYGGLCTTHLLPSVGETKLPTPQDVSPSSCMAARRTPSIVGGSGTMMY